MIPSPQAIRRCSSESVVSDIADPNASFKFRWPWLPAPAPVVTGTVGRNKAGNAPVQAAAAREARFDSVELELAAGQ